MIIFFNTDLAKIHHPRIQYVLDWLKNHPCAPEGVCFEWEKSTPTQIAFERNDSLTLQEIFTQQGNRVGECLYVFYSPTPTRPKIPTPTLPKGEVESAVSALPFGEGRGGDLETLFFHLSRYEEYYCLPALEDAHGMMKSSEQYLCKHGLHHRPVCDLLAFEFWKKLGLTPKRLKTTYRMSHDIDVLEQFPSWYKLFRGTARIIVQREGFSAMWYHWQGFFQRYLLGKKDVYDSFDELLLTNPNIEKVIYFMTGGTTKYEGWYSIFNPKIKEIIALAKQRGYEIGIHPSYNSLDDAEMMTTQRKTLEQIIGQKIKHTRQHFLRFDMRKTPRILSPTPALPKGEGVSATSPSPLGRVGVGLPEDSTLGYRDRIGFRCGTGFPYRLYDFEKECAYDFIETPMIVMDISWRREFPNDLDRVGEELMNFLEKNKEMTKITFNIHNTFFDNVVSEGRGKLLHEVYRKIGLVFA